MIDAQSSCRGVKAHCGAIDVRVGRRLRLARKARGMTQKQLAAAIGVAFQNIQKYESGDVRISAGRLYQFAQVLSAPLSFFYADVQDEVTAPVDINLCVELTRLSGLQQRAMREFLKLSENHAFALSEIAKCLNQRRA